MNVTALSWAALLKQLAGGLCFSDLTLATCNVPLGDRCRSGFIKMEIVVSITLFWGVGLAALGWLAFEIAEFM
jgi:hypothetical protein